MEQLEENIAELDTKVDVAMDSVVTIGDKVISNPSCFFKYKIMLLFSIHLMQLVKSCTKQFRF